MLLVFLVILILSILIITLRLEIEINANIKIDNKILNQLVGDSYKLDPQSKIKIKLYTLNKIKIVQIKIDEQKIKKITKNNKIKNTNKKQIIKRIKGNKPKINIFKIIEIKKLNLILEIGIEEIIGLVYVIPIISTLLSMLNLKINNKGKYKIIPIYNENKLKIKFDCIISTKLIHIINIMWKIIRKRDESNERTSNRRSYAYSNE